MRHEAEQSKVLHQLTGCIRVVYPMATNLDESLKLFGEPVSLGEGATTHLPTPGLDTR